jgi:hypothetical protein
MLYPSMLLYPLIFENHSLAAFEVYIRRAYKAYTLLSIDYEDGDTLDDGEVPPVVTWRFNLGQSHSPPDTPRLATGYVAFLLFLLLYFLRVSSQDV